MKICFSSTNLDLLICLYLLLVRRLLPPSVDSRKYNQCDIKINNNFDIWRHFVPQIMWFWWLSPNMMAYFVELNIFNVFILSKSLIETTTGKIIWKCRKTFSYYTQILNNDIILVQNGVILTNLDITIQHQDPLCTN